MSIATQVRKAFDGTTANNKEGWNYDGDGGNRKWFYMNENKWDKRAEILAPFDIVFVEILDTSHPSYNGAVIEQWQYRDVKCWMKKYPSGVVVFETEGNL